MKPNKEGKYRINFYLNPENPKDKVIIEYLNQRYSPTDYIKETLYGMAYGREITHVNLSSNRAEIVKKKEEYEEIEELDDIEI